MTDNQKIQKLIESSFIDPEKKAFLLNYIATKGVDMRFFDIFNDYLVEATRERGEGYKQTASRIDNLQDELDARITEEKLEIENRLEQELSVLDPSDTKTKKRLWEEYYATLDELGERYNRGLKEIVSKILTSAT